MAFDLVQYFVEQIETQKPELLKEYTKEERRKYISEINALTLGKLITEWRHNPQKFIMKSIILMNYISWKSCVISLPVRKSIHSGSSPA